MKTKKEGNLYKKTYRVIITVLWIASMFIFQAEGTEIPDIQEETRIEKSLPAGISGRFKSYMDYRAITNRRSTQWKLQQSAVTDNEGFRRYRGLYMIALGTYYSPQAGLEFEIEFDSGKVIRCITGDVKNNRHTDKSNRYAVCNGNIVEFIVDTRVISRVSRRMGDMSYSGMMGGIVRITQINKAD